MQINKKVLSVSVTALLLLSVLAVAAPAFAITAGNTDLSTPASFVDPNTPATPVTSATVGQKIVVSGIDAAAFNPITVYWDTVSSANIIGTTSAGAPPNQANPTWWNVTITVPAAVNGIHNVIITDGTGNIAKPLTVVASLSAGVGVIRKLPGDSVTLTGTGYAASSDVTVTLDSTTLGTPVSITLTAPEITTDATGSFTAEITIPMTITAADYDTYTITATDAASNSATASVQINYYVIVTPSGLAPAAPVPPGVSVTFSGRITPSTAFTIQVDTVTVASGTSGADGTFSVPYTLPTLIAAATHTVHLTAGSLVVPDASLRTGAAPTATLSASSGIAGVVVTLTLANFDSKANVTLSFDTTVVNSTAADSRFGPTATDGTLVTEFTVPALTPGVYGVSVVDQYGASAIVVGGFTITAAPVTTVQPRAASYLQGDTISFVISSTDPLFASPTLTISTGGLRFWNAVPLATTTIGSTIYVLYEQQVDSNGNHFMLPIDAPTGTWNWTVSYTDAIGAHTSSATGWKTGTFEVGQGGASGIISAINALNGTIVSINNNVATIKTSVGTTLATDVSSIKGTVTSIQNSVATLNIPDIGTVTAKLDSLDAVLGVVAGDTATLKTNLGDVTTSLSSINTQVTSINHNVATIQTDVGTMQGTITSVTGNIATIQTTLGTIQTDISGLQGSVSSGFNGVSSDISGLQTDVNNAKSTSESLSPLIIVAIVLALIAAIAAIASIVLMRRKIAG
jgi:hypothetical protein